MPEGYNPLARFFKTLRPDNYEILNRKNNMFFEKLKPMTKYSKKAQDTVESAMHRMHKGTLKSGNGTKVKSRKQAIAIGLSEAREKGAKVPKKKTAKTASTRTRARRTIKKGSAKKAK